MGPIGFGVDSRGFSVHNSPKMSLSHLRNPVKRKIAQTGNKFSAGLSKRLKFAFGSLSVAEVARRTRYPYRTVHNYLQGREPSLKFLCDVAEEFDVSLDWLLKGVPPQSARKAMGRPGSRLVRIREPSKGGVIRPLSPGEVKRVAEEEARYTSAKPADPEIIRLMKALADLREKNPKGFSALKSMVEALRKKK